MKNSLLILAFFAAGILLGHLKLLPAALGRGELFLLVLWAMLFCAGIGVGFDLKAFGIIRRLKGKILLVPLGVIVGSTLGGLLAGLILPGLSVWDGLAVASGYGYYSLTSVVIGQWGDAALGSTALLANMLRELLAICLPGLLVSLGGRLGPIMTGGATSMDSSLLAVIRTCGEQYGILAVFSGICLTVIVPLVLPLVLGLQAWLS